MEFLNKKQKIILICIIIIMCMVILYYIISKTETKDYEEFEISEENETTQETENQVEDNIIIVHVSGEVNNPGIIELKEGSRIADAIEKAGGSTEYADLSKINLAYEIKDGQKINIPSKQEIIEVYIQEEAGENVLENEVKNSKVNINTALQTELETLTGIGPSTALKIIDYRKENGEFKSIEDIKNVPGIGESKFENIEEEICVK